MAGKVCKECSFIYPSSVSWSKCRICDTQLFASLSAYPAKEWQAEENRRRGIGNYDGVPDKSYAVEVHTTQDDWYYVNSNELENAGLHGVQTGDILLLNDKFYEIIAYSPVAGAFWLDYIQIEGAFDGIEKALNPST